RRPVPPAVRCIGRLGGRRLTTWLALSTARSASLAAASVGNAEATSGSRRTRLEPFFRRAAYFPRTPPFMDEKSYSGRSSFDLLRLLFFIEPPLSPRSEPSADDANRFASVRVRHHERSSR